MRSDDYALRVELVRGAESETDSGYSNDTLAGADAPTRNGKANTPPRRLACVDAPISTS